MLVYGLQKQQCEKHFRRIHPSLNVVVSRSPFLPLFPPHTVLGNCTSTKSRKKERTNIHLPFFHNHHHRSRRDQQQGSREGTCAALTQSHHNLPETRPSVPGQKPEGKIASSVRSCRGTSIHIISSLRCSVFRSPTFLYHQHRIDHRRRGGQQHEHRITFTQRDFGIVGRTSKKEQKSSLNSTRRRRELTVVRIEHENREAFGGESAERT